MRQIAGLGRTGRPSTSVSALAFRNAREAAPSRATHQYFGLGHNQPVTGSLPSTGTPGALAGSIDGDCRRDLGQWRRPVRAAELVTASRTLSSDSALPLPGAAVTATAARERPDLNPQRIHIGRESGRGRGCTYRE